MIDLRLRAFHAVQAVTIAAALLATSIAPASAQQAPGWSRGQQHLAIAYDECLRRASSALTSENYRIDYSGGNFRVGIKDPHTAVIICDPTGKEMAVQIVVASNAEGGGAERQRLQARMEGRNPGTASGNAPAGRGNWTINLIGCGDFLSRQFAADLQQASNGVVSGTVYGKFADAKKAQLITDKSWGDPGSTAGNGNVHLVVHPDGWASVMVFSGTWDGSKFAGKMHHYTNDDCNFTMVQNR